MVLYLCPGQDSNLHPVIGTSPSSWRVYQFHHLGKYFCCSGRTRTFTEGTKIPCATITPRNIVVPESVGVPGLEPGILHPEWSVLPLHQTPMCVKKKIPHFLVWMCETWDIFRLNALFPSNTLYKFHTLGDDNKECRHLVKPLVHSLNPNMLFLCIHILLIYENLFSIYLWKLFFESFWNIVKKTRISFVRVTV